MNNEIWMSIPENISAFRYIDTSPYLISNYGRLRNKYYSEDSNYAFKSVHYTQSGTPRFSFKYKSHKASIVAAKLVLLAFSYREDYEDHYAIYFDGDKNNYKLDNICWDDYTKFGKLLLTYPRYPNIPTEEGEIWMPIPEYIMPDIDPTGYYVSSHGRIFSTRLNTSCLLKPHHTSNKAKSYTSVALPTRDGGKYKKDKSIHRIVLMSFNPIVGMNELDVNHIDGNTFNNRLDNLEWVNRQENVYHAFSIGLINIGEASASSLYPTSIINEILDLYISNLNRKDIQDIISNKYSIDIKLDYIDAILACRIRMIDISNYMIYHGYSLYSLFGSDSANILNDINSNIGIRDLRKKHNTSNNRVKDLSLNLSFYILKNNVWRWITYLDYGLNN